MINYFPRCLNGPYDPREEPKDATILRAGLKAVMIVRLCQLWRLVTRSFLAPCFDVGSPLEHF